MRSPNEMKSPNERSLSGRRSPSERSPNGSDLRSSNGSGRRNSNGSDRTSPSESDRKSWSESYPRYADETHELLQLQERIRQGECVRREWNVRVRSVRGWVLQQWYVRQ